MQAGLTIRSYGLRDLTGANLDKLADEELFACLKAGHHDALAILFRRYHLIVLKIARNILRDSAEAEDLMQAVFLDLEVLRTRDFWHSRRAGRQRHVFLIGRQKDGLH